MPAVVPVSRLQLRSREPRRSIDRAELKAEADAIDARIRRTVACQRQDTRRLAYDLAEMDRDRRWSAYEFKSLVGYARDRGVDYSGSQIRQLVAVVRSLERLPWSRKAFAKGVAGWTRFRELARYATPENERALLADMLAMSAEQFQERLRRLRGAPDRRKLTFEVTPEERDVVLAAIANARASDPGLTNGQALAHACKSYVEGGAASTAPPPSIEGRSPPAEAPPEVERPADAPAVAEPDIQSVAPSATGERRHASATTLTGDDPASNHTREPRCATRRGVQLVVELDPSGLSVRRVDGLVVGKASFARSRPPGPRLEVLARPEVVVTPDADVRAG